MKLDFNIGVDTDVKLNKLYNDQKNFDNNVLINTGTKVDPSFQSNKTNAYGGYSSSETETMDFTQSVTASSNKEDITSNINSSSNNDVVSSNANTLNSTSSSNINTSSNGDIKQSTSSNSSLKSTNTSSHTSNASTTTSNTTSNLNTNIDSSNTTNLNNNKSSNSLESNSLKMSSTSGNNSKIDLSNSTSSGSTNLNSNMSSSNTSSLNSNNMSTTSNSNMNATSINMNESMDTKMSGDNEEDMSTDDASTSSNTKSKISLSGVTSTYQDRAHSFIKPEIYVEKYTDILKDHGIILSDIYRVNSGNITLKGLLQEIENDTDNERRKEILTVSYLQYLNIDARSLTDLEKLTSSLEKEILDVGDNGGDTVSLQEELYYYQKVYDFVSNITDYEMDYVDKYIHNKDYNKESVYDSIMDTLLDNESLMDYSTGLNTIWLDDKDDTASLIYALINGDVKSIGASIMYYQEDSYVAFKTRDDLINHYSNQWLNSITDTEKKIFNFIYNTEGATSAYNYLEGISDTIDNRWLAKKTQDDEEYATEHPFLTSIASIVITPIEGIGAAIYSIKTLLTNEEIKRTDVYSSGDVWRSAVACNIAQDSTTLSFIYSTGMSMVDSAVLIGTNILTGGVAAPVLSATIMGSKAYVSTLNDSLDKGASDGTAILLASVNAVIESVMENYSLGHLMGLENDPTIKNIMSNVTERLVSNLSNEKIIMAISKLSQVVAYSINQAIVEGDEELCTEIIDYIADIFISKDLSDFSISLETYMDYGYDEKESVLLTLQDLYKRVQQAFLGGFVSGFLFGALGGLASSRNVTNQVSEELQNKYLAQNTTTNENGATVINENTELSGSALDVLKNYTKKIYKGDMTDLSVEEAKLVNDINSRLNNPLHKNETVTINASQMPYVTPRLLKYVNDLSRVRCIMDSQFRDIYGSYFTVPIGSYSDGQSLNSSDAQIKIQTYTGDETVAILTKINEMCSKVDKDLSPTLKAYQIYDIISKEIPWMPNSTNPKNCFVAQSLRGIIENNDVHRKGLICAGDAALFKEMCDRLDVQCGMVRGVITDENGVKHNHVWNVILNENNEMISVDVSAKISSGREYFGNNDNFALTHTPNEEFRYNVEYSLDENVPISISNSKIVLNNIANNDFIGVSGYEVLKNVLYARDKGVDFNDYDYDSYVSLVKLISTDNIKLFLKDNNQEYSYVEMVENNLVDTSKLEESAIKESLDNIVDVVTNTSLDMANVSSSTLEELKGYQVEKDTSKLTDIEKTLINKVNKLLEDNPDSKVTINEKESPYLTPDGLMCISDLSRVNVILDQQFRDINAVLINAPGGFTDGVSEESSNSIEVMKTYTGDECYNILSKIFELNSRVNSKLSSVARARQIYNIIANNMKWFPKSEWKNNMKNFFVAQSLRGIIDNNSAGKQGLVCTGFAGLFKEMCERNRIQCGVILGNAGVDNEGHAWNVILDDDDNAIIVDVSWHASDGKDYFGGNDYFAGSHTPNPELSYDIDYKERPPILYKESDVKIILDNIVEENGLSILEEFLSSKENNTYFNTSDSNGYLEFLNIFSKEEIESYLKESASLFVQASNTINSSIVLKNLQTYNPSSNLQTKSLTKEQIEFVNRINNKLSDPNFKGKVVLSSKAMKSVTSSMLSSINDLSRVKCIMDSMFRDMFDDHYIVNGGTYSNGIKGAKEAGQHAIETYTGEEAYFILEKIENIVSRINPNLSTSVKIRQVYAIISQEMKWSTNHAKSAMNEFVAQSLRGITDNNSTGKQGLVCSGFSALCVEVCNRLDIQCGYVVGQVIKSDGSRSGHAWNLYVDEEGNIIPMDITWHAVSGKDFFGGNEEFYNTHVPFDIFNYDVDYLTPKKPFKLYKDADIVLDYIANEMFDDTSSGLELINSYINAVNNGEDFNVEYDGYIDLLKQIPLDYVKNYLRNKGKIVSNTSNNIVSKINNNSVSNINTILNGIISDIDSNTSSGIGLKILKEYAITENIDLIPPSKRSSIQNISLPTIERYVRNLESPSSMVAGSNSFVESADLENTGALFLKTLFSKKNTKNTSTSTSDTIINNSNNLISKINERLRNTNGTISLTLRNTGNLNTDSLKNIANLRRVNFIMDLQLCDMNGKFMEKYNEPKYQERVTYNGMETYSILKELDYLQSLVNMKLPITERVLQIIDIIYENIPVMRDANSYKDGLLIAQSLRGITSENTAGKKGMVCAGYAALGRELCLRCGIKCDYVRGIGITNHGISRHAWNVFIDENGNAIPFDICWYCCGAKNTFGRSDEFASSHIADEDETFKDYSPLRSIEDFNVDDVMTYLDMNRYTIKQVQQKIIKENQDFSLSGFFSGKTGYDGGILFISPKQAIMTDTFVKNNNATTYGDHSNAVKEIIRGITNDNDFNFNLSSVWQRQVTDYGICIQLCTTVSSLVWLPSTISQEQYDYLVEFNNKIKQIYNYNPSYFSNHPMIFETEDTFSINNIDDILVEAKKRIGLSNNGNEVILGKEITSNKNNYEGKKELNEREVINSAIGMTIRSMQSKSFKGAGFYSLWNYSDTGNADGLDNIVKSISPVDISYVMNKNIKDIESAISIMDEKYGTGVGISSLKGYVATNNLSAITREDNARENISHISSAFIEEYLLYRNIYKKGLLVKTSKDIKLDNLLKEFYGNGNGLYDLMNYSKGSTDNLIENRYGGNFIKNVLQSYTKEEVANYLDKNLKMLDYVIQNIDNSGKDATIVLKKYVNGMEIDEIDVNTKLILNNVSMPFVKEYITSL